MDETQTGTQPGATPGAAPTDGAGAPAPNESGEPLVPQSTLNKLDAQHKREAKALLAKMEAQEAELAALRQAEDERKRAQLSEVERAKQDADEAAKLRADADARAKAAEARALRAELIATNAVDLPPVYRALIAGSDEQSITASIEALRGQYAADRQNVAASLLSEVATKTPEELTPLYGEAVAGLAAQLRGRPGSIGAPPQHGQTQSPPPQYGEDGNFTTEAWREERKRMGVGATNLTR